MKRNHLIALIAVIALVTNLPFVYASTSTFITPVVNAVLNGGFTNGPFGVATTSPSATLAVALNTTDASTSMQNPAFVIASTTGNGVSTTTVNLLRVSRSGQVAQGGTLPTIATSTGSGTGNVPVTMNGSPNFLYLNLTTGTAPAQLATVATITLPTACPNAVVPGIDPASVSSLSTSTVMVYASSTSATTFIIATGPDPLLASTNYIWNIHIDCY